MNWGFCIGWVVVAHGWVSIKDEECEIVTAEEDDG
jgi:hypothetical protein